MGTTIADVLMERRRNIVQREDRLRFWKVRTQVIEFGERHISHLIIGKTCCLDMSAYQGIRRCHDYPGEDWLRAFAEFVA